MKKMKSILEFMCLVMLTLLISCGETPSNDSQDEVTEQQTEEVSYPDSLVYITKKYERVFPECLENCTTYDLEYIELANKDFDFINDSIKVELIGNYKSMDDAADEFFDDYEEVALDIGNEGFNPPWSHSLTAGVDFNQKGLFTVSYGYYGYLGGAHGMPGFYSSNYDLETKKELTLNDLLNSKDSTVLKTLGEKYFRIDNEIGLNDDLGEAGYFWDNKGFYFSEIFTLTNAGLMFTYSPYEIGPYAIGMPNFIIPYTELQPYFTENSVLKRLIE
ncbi:MAG: RsiV family protein [Saprospiraceae bacterium]